MDIPDNILSRFQVEKKKGGSERAELIGRVEKFTNPSRIKAGYEPLTGRDIGIILGKKKVGLPRLRDLVAQAEKSNNASQYFWGLLKSKS